MSYGLRTAELVIACIIGTLIVGAPIKFPADFNDFLLLTAAGPILPFIARLSAAVFKVDAKISRTVDIILIFLCGFIYALSALASYNLKHIAERTKFKFWDYHVFCMGLKCLIVIIILIDIIFTFLSGGRRKKAGGEAEPEQK